MANNQLRNISQSAQEREIIKTAPDMVVYIEGLPFILNPYLKQSDSDLVTVNFNDYITAVQTSYTVDSLMPTGSVHLIVPNGLKHLFLAPGGNLIFQVMSSIRIYAKCYFFSKTGNTVFRRIFNGVIKSLEYTETQTGLEISIAIAGIMRLLEIVQMDLSPSLMTEGNFPSQVFRSNQAQMSLYEAIYESFDRAMDFGEFLKYALSQDSVKNSVHGGKDVGVALTQEYMVKWTLRLNDLRRDVRIFGGSGTKKLHDPVEESSKALTDAKKALATKKKADPAKDNPARPVKTADTVTANDKGNKLQLSMLKKYHFDMAVSGIEIAGGHLTPRLERIRQLIELAGLEGYQDIDGLIIVKPPLYNLDSTVLGPLPSNKMDPNDPLSDENLYEEANPYIINMAEVLSENFNEDESGIRKTSMTLTPAWSSPS
ncbi:MAG: hypothetical protein WCQ50_22475, partial [Spirochaetota bacterium]